MTENYRLNYIMSTIQFYSSLLHPKLKTSLLVWSTIIVCLGTPLSQASGYQSHQSIYQTAIKFMKKHLAQNYRHSATITHGHLDNRLRLTQCDHPLIAFLPEGSRNIGRTSIGIRCNGSKPWSLHVALTVSMYKTIAVAAKLLPRGTLLNKHDIRMKKIDLATLPQGYINHASELLGLKLKRRLAIGVAFTPASVEKPQRIKRGQRVTILARSGAMEVRMTGKALASGAIGDRIRVMNIKSRQKREGIITPQGEIQIQL